MVLLILSFVNSRLYEEMKDFFQFDMQIPSSDALMIHELKKWLTLAGSVAKVVVVLDALNQLDDGSGVDGGYHYGHLACCLTKTSPAFA